MLNNLAHVCVHYYAITDFWAKYGKTHFFGNIFTYGSIIAYWTNYTNVLIIK